MVEAINPLSLGNPAPLEDKLKLSLPPPNPLVETDPFSTVLDRAVKALEGVSEVENRANQLIQDYAAGKADLQDVMLATSKMGIMVQLAVTTITSAVSTFKEITQMQV